MERLLKILAFFSLIEIPKPLQVELGDMFSQGEKGEFLIRTVVGIGYLTHKKVYYVLMDEKGPATIGREAITKGMVFDSISEREFLDESKFEYIGNKNEQVY